MSRSVDDRLRELETEVRHLEVLPAAAVRARGRRRGRRQTAVVLAGVAVAATTAGVAATTGPDRPPQRPAAPVALDCDLTLPTSPAGVRVQVRAGATATGLRERGYTVLDVEPAAEPSGPATLRYGPAAVGAASLLRAALTGEVSMRFEPARPGDTVELTPGTTPVRLATATQLNRALAAAGPPSAPPEC